MRETGEEDPASILSALYVFCFMSLSYSLLHLDEMFFSKIYLLWGGMVYCEEYSPLDEC